MKKYVSTNQYDKATQPIEWMDEECNLVHQYNESYRAWMNR